MRFNSLSYALCKCVKVDAACYAIHSPKQLCIEFLELLQGMQKWEYLNVFFYGQFSNPGSLLKKRACDDICAKLYGPFSQTVTMHFHSN